MQKTKTGIYGGSFNPIHNGHIAIARRIAQLAALDEVWLMVSPQNPLKRADDLADDRLRLEMTRRAIASYPELKASDYEFGMPRPSYMIDTLNALSRDYPEREFTLLIGADNWALFDRWYHADEIIDRYHIIIYPRPGYDIDVQRLPHTVTTANTGMYNVSSTQVRKLVRDGGDISQLVPENIAEQVKQIYRKTKSV